MKKLLAIVILLVSLVVVFSIGQISDNYADARQAQAAIEAARAAQIASAGQATTSFMLSGLAVVLAFLVALLLTAVLWLAVRLNRAQQTAQPAGRWLSGPNARWGRTDQQRLPSSGMDRALRLAEMQLLNRLINDQRNTPTLAELTTPGDDDLVEW